VSRIGYEDAGAPQVATGLMVRANNEDAREFALRPRGGLQADSREPADFLDPFLELVHEQQAALGRFNRLERVGGCEPGQSGGLLVDARIVFHGTGAEGVKSLVDTVIEAGEARKMSNDIHFRDFRKWKIGTQEAVWQRAQGNIWAGECYSAAPWGG